MQTPRRFLSPVAANAVVVDTYRYLRVGLIGLVLLLFTSIGIEWSVSGTRLRSISAYYFTPAHAVFVGVLVTMAVCLIAMKGSTDTEDVLLNFAGMLAPGVAFVPTVRPDPCPDCTVMTDPGPAVANNMQALFLVGVVAAMFALVMARRSAATFSTTDIVGLAVTGVTLVGGAIWFYVARDLFLTYAHSAAAGLMFAALIAVVWLNARGVQQQPGPEDASQRRYITIYRVLAGAMLVGLVGAFVLQYLVPNFKNLVFWLEVLLIATFGAFWVVQTVELWDTGVRVEPPGPGGEAQ